LSIQDLRRNYLFGSLSRDEMPKEPMPFFRQWFAQVQSAELPDWFEVNAMTLSTSNPSGRTHSRIVLLKKLEDEGLLFFTNYASHKAAQISDNAHVALHFYWPMFDRQVRVEGTAYKTEPPISDEYFASRPRSSQLGAIASPQSQPIDEHTLLESMKRLEEKYLDQPIPRPECWGGYRVVPDLFEFWQGKPSRLHDRFQYRRDDSVGGWIIERLAP
jgi:pyridoxamine 5'-phosphate oxidase